MLDVHPAHHAATTWRDFFIHIATIVLGLIIAVGLEQTVEYIHHRRELADTRESLRKERKSNAARFAVETLEYNRVVPVFQDDLAVFVYLRSHPGAPPEKWPGGLGGQVLTVSYSDAAWRAAQQSNIVQFMLPAELQETGRMYRYQQSLNDLEATKFDAMNELRKTFAAQPDPSRLTSAQLDSAIDRTVDLLVICAKIANRQVSLSTAFPDFTPAPQGDMYAQVLHWPKTTDSKPDRAKAFDEVGRRYHEINRTEAADEATGPDTPAPSK